MPIHNTDHRKNDRRCGTVWPPSLSKLLCLHSVCSPIRVRCGNISLFEYCIISCIDHTYDTPLCRRTTEKTSNFKCSHNGLKWVSRWCRYGEALTVMVSIQSSIYSQFSCGPNRKELCRDRTIAPILPPPSKYCNHLAQTDLFSQSIRTEDRWYTQRA